MLYGDRPESFYRTWSIKKRSGGQREIKAPRSTLYRLQKTLNHILQAAYEPRPAAHGFVTGRSVISNAERHVGRRFVLNLDLLNFFPSIHFGRVRGLFLAAPFGCSDEAATSLAQLCCTQGALPIGAPTSPVIANMICLRLDRELQRLARSTGCWYSRYADDLTFSTDRSTFPKPLAAVGAEGEISLGDPLTAVIESNGFQPNRDKTRLQTRGGRQEVTGLVVNERLNVDRRFIRRIRAMLHAWDRFGLDAAQTNMRKWYTKDRYPGAAPRFNDVLQGRIAYLEMVRGKKDPLVVRFRTQYRNLQEGRELHHGVLPVSSAVKERLKAASEGGAATPELIQSVGDVPADLLDRWSGRTDVIGTRVSNAIRFFNDATDADGLRLACRELADALEPTKNEARQLLYNKEVSDLFFIANRFGIRHLDDNQFTEYRPEFLIWIFWSYLHTVDLLDQMIRDPGPAAPQPAAGDDSPTDSDEAESGA